MILPAKITFRKYLNLVLKLHMNRFYLSIKNNGLLTMCFSDYKNADHTKKRFVFMVTYVYNVARALR